jgi:hypothetical protein
MKAMVQFHLKSGSKEQALALFEERGPNRIPGVSLQGAWIGVHCDVVFVLVECPSEAAVAQAAESWKGHGEFTIYPVLDIEQY